MRQQIINSIDTLFYVLYFLFKENFRNYMGQCKKETDTQKTVHVLANGPSLKFFLHKLENDFERYAKDDFCGMNYIADIDLYAKIRPKYYALSDPQFFKEGLPNSEKAQILFERMNKETTWTMYLFVPYIYYKGFKSITNKHIVVVPLHSRRYIGFESLRFWFYEKGLGNGEFGTVLQNAIYALINLDVKHICLHGADHNYFNGLEVTENNCLCYRYQHFYDNGNEQVQPVSFGGSTCLSVHEYLSDLAYLFKGHEILNKYAQKRGCKIKNCTPHSFIDSYSKEIV